jgi:hypothetical protein
MLFVVLLIDDNTPVHQYIEHRERDGTTTKQKTKHQTLSGRIERYQSIKILLAIVPVLPESNITTLSALQLLPVVQTNHGSTLIEILSTRSPCSDMIQHAQSIADTNIQNSVRTAFQSILEQTHPHDDVEIPYDVIELLQQFRAIWKRKLLDRGYDVDTVNGWFAFLDVLDSNILNDNDGLFIHSIIDRPITHHRTTSFINHQISTHTINAPSPNQEAESNRPSFTTAWGKLRHFCRRQDLLSGDLGTAKASSSETTATITSMLEQLDTYGYNNETYWIKDMYLSIQKYADEQIGMRLYYTTSQASINTKVALDQTNDAPNGNDESLRTLLLVDRKRKSVNRKKLLWDTSSQRYLSKEPSKKRIKTSNLGDNVDSAQQVLQRTITLPDIPRLPYDEKDFSGTLNWKVNMDCLFIGSQLDKYIHLSSELETQQSTSLLIGSICDAGQFHYFLQSYAAQSSTGERISKRLHRKAIRTRLGNHLPIRISDDIHGRANNDNSRGKPWSKILRTMSLRQTGNSNANNMQATATTEVTDDVSMSFIETTERERSNLCSTDSTQIEVEQKPQYWFDFDIGYCMLEYVVEGTRTVCAFSNIELSLSDD